MCHWDRKLTHSTSGLDFDFYRTCPNKDIGRKFYEIENLAWRSSDDRSWDDRVKPVFDKKKNTQFKCRRGGEWTDILMFSAQDVLIAEFLSKNFYAQTFYDWLRSINRRLIKSSLINLLSNLFSNAS